MLFLIGEVVGFQTSSKTNKEDVIVKVVSKNLNSDGSISATEVEILVSNILFPSVGVAVKRKLRVGDKVFVMKVQVGEGVEDFFILPFYVYTNDELEDLVDITVDESARINHQEITSTGGNINMDSPEVSISGNVRMEGFMGTDTGLHTLISNIKSLPDWSVFKSIIDALPSPTTANVVAATLKTAVNAAKRDLTK